MRILAGVAVLALLLTCSSVSAQDLDSLYVFPGTVDRVGSKVLKVQGEERTIRFRLVDSSTMPETVEEGNRVVVRYSVQNGVYTVVRVRHLRARERFPSATFPAEGAEASED